MKVLILTKPEYADFIGELIFPYNAEHDVHAYHGKPPYPFETWLGIYDIGISFMYTHKVPKSELDKATWFNFHPAPLPEYKGRDLCYHAIMNGETEFGATLHYMDENFDTGGIIEVGRFPIVPKWTAQDLSYWAVAASKHLFVEFFPRIISGEKFRAYPNQGGTYYKKGQIVEELIQSPDEPFGQWVRAVTFKDFYPKLNIGGRSYKIVRDE